VKLDILVAFIVIFIHSLPNLGGAESEKDPNILDFVNVDSDDGIRKLYPGVLTADNIIEIIPVKSVKRD
jgi:hypothetical protein